MPNSTSTSLKPLDIPPELYDDAVTIYYSFSATTFSYAAVVCLILYDHLLTINEEINCIWRRKFSVASAIFVINRYLLLALALIIGLEFMQESNNSILVSRCRALDITANAIGYVLSATFAAFTVLRIYAILERSISAAIILATVNTLFLVATIIFITTQFYDVSLRVQLPYLACANTVAVPGHGYDQFTSFLSADARNVTLDIIWITAELLTLGLTASKTFKLTRESHQLGVHVTVTSLLLRDGSIQFLTVLCINIIDVIMTVTSPIIFVSIFTYVLQSILLSHMFFHLRQVHLSSHSSVNSSSFAASNLHFASMVVGNLGAPLHNIFTESHEEIEAERDQISVSSNPLATALPLPILDDEDESNGLVLAQQMTARYTKVSTHDLGDLTEDEHSVGIHSRKLSLVLSDEKNMLEDDPELHSLMSVSQEKL
ncbi:unnamed protein product [Somion occarium]|uniref:DUF6533 domain-containing protein n=1 Tax=Somion occarium TaxID=3059160 RepID=A0ABP1CU57_9APHY